MTLLEISPEKQHTVEKLTLLGFQQTRVTASQTFFVRNPGKNGYDPSTGHVTLMLHTFVSDNLEFVREQVRQPFIEYLESSIDLWRNNLQDLELLTPSERETLLAYAFERYFQTAALFGTPSSCLKMVNELKKIGVNEIACLIDFGVDADLVLSNLDHLNQLRQIAKKIDNTQTNQKFLHKNGNYLIEKELIISKLNRIITQCISCFLQIEADKISSVDNFFVLGIDSLKFIEIIGVLQEKLNIFIPSNLMIEYPTIIELSKYLAKHYEIKIEDDILVIQDKAIPSELIFGIELEFKSEKELRSITQNKRITGEL